MFSFNPFSSSPVVNCIPLFLFIGHGCYCCRFCSLFFFFLILFCEYVNCSLPRYVYCSDWEYWINEPFYFRSLSHPHGRHRVFVTHTFSMQICPAAASRAEWLGSTLFSYRKSDDEEDARRKKQYWNVEKQQPIAWALAVPRFFISFFTRFFLRCGKNRNALQAGQMFACVVMPSQSSNSSIFTHGSIVCDVDFHVRKMCSSELPASVIDVALCSTHGCDASCLGAVYAPADSNPVPIANMNMREVL